MTSTRMIGPKSPTWIRALQIGIGIIAIGLSLAAVMFPVFTIVAAFTAAAIILLLFGIEQIVGGIFLYKRSRFAHLGLGILVIILSSIVMAFPIASATFVVLLAAFGLLFSGISSIIAGLRGEKSREDGRNTASAGSRALSIAAGALAIALSVMIMISPLFGVALAALVIGIALLVYGIRLVVAGIAGRIA